MTKKPDQINNRIANKIDKLKSFFTILLIIALSSTEMLKLKAHKLNYLNMVANIIKLNPMIIQFNSFFNTAGK